jgi:hypothetical protein
MGSRALARRRRRRLPRRLATAVFLLLALAVSAQVTRDVPLSVRIVDAATGRPTPVRVSLQDANGNTPGVSAAVSISETAIPIPREAISVMWGQQDRAQGYALQPDGSFYVDGAFEVLVPPGAYTLTLSKGFEYERQVARIAVAPGSGISREFRMTRWIDMPARGWYSADDHIHLRRSPRDDPAIVRWIAAEDIHVGNLLEMGDFWATYYSQYAFGPKGRYEETGRWLSPGQEEPRTPEVGHTISLGASEFVRFRGDYYSYDRLFDRIHELGGVTGFAHQAFSFHGYRGLVLNTLRQKTDFIELAQFCVPEGPLAVDHYYLLLDLGFRLTALAGSDFPWCGRGPLFGLPAPAVAQIGNARFYTYVGGPLTFDAWFGALKAGRTFVSTGPVVQLTVNGRLPGDAIDVAPGTRLRVSAEALGHADQAPLRSLEIVGHSRVLARSEGAGVTRLTAEIELPVERGLWIAARAEAGTAQSAHTTPVYVTVNGGGFHNAATMQARVDTAERYLQELEDDATKQGAPLDSQAWRHRAQIDRQIADARARLGRLPR